MKTLDWQQDGFNWRAQGLLRVYHVVAEPLGTNRFKPVIQRGAVTFYCDVSFENLDDAKHFCQADHDSILSVHADLERDLEEAVELLREVLPSSPVRYSNISVRIDTFLARHRKDAK